MVGLRRRVFLKCMRFFFVYDWFALHIERIGTVCFNFQETQNLHYKYINEMVACTYLVLLAEKRNPYLFVFIFLPPHHVIALESLQID